MKASFAIGAEIGKRLLNQNNKGNVLSVQMEAAQFQNTAGSEKSLLSLGLTEN